MPDTTRPVMAKYVCVTHLYQAACRVPGCGWTGALHGAWRAASDERQQHLDEHRTLLWRNPHLTEGDAGG